MNDAHPVISLKDASIFIHNILILSDVNLSLQPGEFRYLIGRTGSGKSSLIKTLYGELPLQQGDGEVAGFDLKKLRTRQIPYLRRKLGIVFQDFHLLMDRNIKENLLFVLRATGWDDKRLMENRIEKVLDSVGLKTKGFKRPHQLSGGEQQRVVIARALLNEPEIILADEPTGNLDPQTSDEIMTLLSDIHKQGKAILMATHNYSLIRKFPSSILKVDKDGVSEVGAEVLM
ncbi:MAG TPA: ATP-binding cassette domain-containing protein [Bacteroidales bacterium]|nr:ATP-binding cassette domain-containing protein [Bacteroidales bacterium]HRZ48976.1 ATP-binding cassette domain-containing protein [Bacteroidales bacterium]